MLRQLFAYRNLLLLFLLLNSGFIFLTDDKKAGIPFTRELFMLGTIALTGFLLLSWQRLYQSKACLWVLFMGICLPVASACLAKLNWGQPIIYGLLEERRSFFYLTFFPVLFLLIKTNPTQEQVERFFVISAMACAVIGFLYYLKIIPQNAGVAFQVDVKELGDEETLLRPDRYRIGNAYVSLCAFMLMYQMKERISLAKLGILLFLTAYLWLVMQTRTVMVTWAIAGLWIFRNRIDSLLKVGILAAMILVASWFLVPEFWTAQFDKFDALLNDASAGPGVRAVTTAISMQAVRENAYVGLGALSLQWNGGFGAIYNPQFYLSDVGIIGVYYRYGFLVFPIALIFYIGFLRIMKRCHNKGALLSALQLSFWFQIFNLLLSNSLMYGGSTYGMAAALFLYYAKASVPEPSSNQRREWVNYANVQYRHN